MYSCDACDYSTQYKGDLKKHIMFHEGIKKYICHNCGFKYTTSSDLQRHMRTHENVKNFICSFRSCGFSTSRIENLVNHESTHTSLEARLTHPCHLCKKSFSSRSILNRHMKTCSKPMNPNLRKEAVSTKCGICDKVFSNIYKLRQHQKNHSKELGKKKYVFNLFGTFLIFFLFKILFVKPVENPLEQMNLYSNINHCTWIKSFLVISVKKHLLELITC